MLEVMRITVRIREFLTEILPTSDSASSNNLAGSAALAEVCGIRVLLVIIIMFQLCFAYSVVKRQ